MRFPKIGSNMLNNLTLRELGSVTGLVWFVGVVVVVYVFSSTATNMEIISKESDVLRLSSLVKSRAPAEIHETKDTMTTVSSVIRDMKLKENVSQLSASQYGTVVKIDKITTRTLAEILAGFRLRSLEVKSAELRVANYGDEGRLMSAVLTVGGKEL